MHIDNKIVVVYWGHTIQLDIQDVSNLSIYHKSALAEHVAFDIQVLRHMERIAPILVSSDGAHTPNHIIQERMRALSILAPGKEEEVLSEALVRYSKQSGTGAGIQALLLASGMI